MKTFCWPAGSQNTRSAAFDWNDLGSVLNNNYSRSSKRPKWSNEEIEEEKEAEVDPVVQDVVDYAKSNFAQQVYMIKVQSGLSEKEIIILIKAFLTGFKTIAEANMRSGFSRQWSAERYGVISRLR